MKPAILPSSTTLAQCPKCKTGTDHSISSTSKFVKLLTPFIQLKRLWCPGCGTKFYVRN